MDDLRVSESKGYGQHRLSVNLPNGEELASLDRTSGELKVLQPEHEHAVRAALAVHLTPPPPAAEHDLARNRPGEALRDKIRQDSPGGLTRLLRRKTEPDGPRKGLKGEETVGRELQRLSSQGWRALHSITLQNDVDIDHLLIGPGGVFSINTKHHPKQDVWVGDHAVKVDQGEDLPYQRKSRDEAQRVARLLLRHGGLAVEVQPVLVFVGVAELDKVPTLLDVRVYREREVSALAPLNGVLLPEEVELAYAVTRDRRNWHRHAPPPGT